VERASAPALLTPPGQDDARSWRGSRLLSGAARRRAGKLLRTAHRILPIRKTMRSSARPQDANDTVAAGTRLTWWILAALWIPSLLWLWMQLQAIVAVPATLLLGYAFHAMRGATRSATAAPLPARTIGVIVAFSMCWAAFTGLPHIFALSDDWMTRLETLHLFVSPSWQRLHEDGTDYVLRFPGAYYAVAAMFGGMADTGALRFVEYATTALTCALALAALHARTARRALAAFLFIVVCINGLDLPGSLAAALLKGAPMKPFGTHVEWWSGLQYSGLTTAMVWVPNHLLPALLFCALVPMTRAHSHPSMQRAHILMLAAAGTMLWSPLVFLGAAPLVAVEFLAALRAGAWRLDWRTLRPAYILAVVLVMGLVSWYLTLDAGSIRKGWYFQSCDAGTLACGAKLALFYLLEALPLAWLCSRLPNRRIGRAAAATLLVLPLLVYGPSNDLTMRASLPAIVIAAVSLHHLLGSRIGRRAKALLCAFIVVAGYSAASEFWRGITGFDQPAWHPVGFVRSFKETFPQTIVGGYPPHYLAPAATACAGAGRWMLRGCQPAH